MRQMLFFNFEIICSWYMMLATLVIFRSPGSRRLCLHSLRHIIRKANDTLACLVDFCLGNNRFSPLFFGLHDYLKKS